MDTQNGVCRCPHHKVVPGLITLLGLAFLLEAVGVLSTQTVSIAWPTIIILIGLNKAFAYKCTCCGRDR